MSKKQKLALEYGNLIRSLEMLRTRFLLDTWLSSYLSDKDYSNIRSIISSCKEAVKDDYRTKINIQ